MKKKKPTKQPNQSKTERKRHEDRRTILDKCILYDQHYKEEYGKFPDFVQHEDFKPLVMHFTTFRNHFNNYKKDPNNFQLERKKETVPRKQRSNIKNLDEILIPEMIKHIKELEKKGVEWKPEKNFQNIDFCCFFC